MKFVHLVLRNRRAGLPLELAIRCAALRRAAETLAQRSLNAKAKAARGSRQHAEALRIITEAAAIRAASNVAANTRAAAPNNASRKDSHVAP